MVYGASAAGVLLVGVAGGLFFLRKRNGSPMRILQAPAQSVSVPLME
jgi:LPXTG-motif cell wall-anchored protein